MKIYLYCVVLNCKNRNSTLKKWGHKGGGGERVKNYQGKGEAAMEMIIATRRKHLRLDDDDDKDDDVDYYYYLLHLIYHFSELQHCT